MIIKAGDIARLKVTGEDVFVLDIADGMAEVRRPNGGQNGVFHLLESFTLAELETPSENRSRVASEQLALRNLFSKTEEEVEAVTVQ